MSQIHTVTDSNIQSEVLEHEGLVILDFWAEWCNPCRHLTPTLEAIAQERQDVKICKINVDENPVLSQQFSIRNIPLLVFMKNGQKIDSMMGAHSKTSILEKISSLL